MREDGRIPIDPAQASDLVASKRWRVQLLANGCLAWTGGTFTGGYPRTSIGRRHLLAHRVALVAWLGRDLEEYMEAGHVCHDIAFAADECGGGHECPHRRCVNPLHLAEQSRADNIEAVMTGLCAKGLHQMTPDNLAPGSLRQGIRRCKACASAYQNERDALIRAAASSMGMSKQQYAGVYGWGQAVLDALGDDA